MNHLFDLNLKRFKSEPSLGSTRSHFQEKVCQIGVFLAIATGFAIPVSTSLTSLLSLGILACWLVSGQYLVSLELLKKNRVMAISVAFFGLLAVSLFYTPESLSVAVRNLFKYRQFLLIPIYASFFIDPKSRWRGIQMFELAMIVTLICSICYFFVPNPEVDSNVYLRTVFKNRITQNILMSFLVYLAIWKFWEKPRQNWYYAILAAIAAFNIVAMVSGRSGYLALGALICLLLCQKLGYKGLVAAAVCVGGIGILAYNQSNTFHQRINQVVTELKTYGDPQVGYSGVNLRLEFYENSLHLAKSNPVLGSGIGSFGLKYRQLIEGKEQKFTANPHNEYVMLLVQNGVLGLALFLAFFGVAWRATRSMIGLDQAFGQAVLTVYMVVCLVNSLMLDTTEGNLFGFLMGLILAGAGNSIKADHDVTTSEVSPGKDVPQVISDAA